MSHGRTRHAATMHGATGSREQGRRMLRSRWGFGEGSALVCESSCRRPIYLDDGRVRRATLRWDTWRFARYIDILCWFQAWIEREITSPQRTDSDI